MGFQYVLSVFAWVDENLSIELEDFEMYLFNKYISKSAQIS